MEHLRNCNYGFRVLDCLNPTGTVPAFGVTHLKWRFHPIEVMSYQVDVPITTVGGATDVVTFVGRGYHPEEDGAFKPLPEEECANPAAWPGYSHTCSQV
eukprot:1842317-Pyramimonas_sp.AAC.1